MENNNLKRADKKLAREQAEAWVFTLFLGFLVCFGLAIYTLINHNLIFDFPDSSLFRSGLTWLGAVGVYLYFATFAIFWMSSAIVRYLPNKISIANTAVVIGIVLFLVDSVLLWFSYDLEIKQLNYIGFICLGMGANMTNTNSIVKHKYNK